MARFWHARVQRLSARSRASGDNSVSRLIRGYPAMLDPALLRANPAQLAERLRATRGIELPVEQIEQLEAERKRIQVRTQELQNLRNTRSMAIGQA
jgi:hypothetical protein